MESIRILQTSKQADTHIHTQTTTKRNKKNNKNKKQTKTNNLSTDQTNTQKIYNNKV